MTHGACRHEALRKDRSQLKEKLQEQLTAVTKLYQDKDDLNTRCVLACLPTVTELTLTLSNSG